MAQKTDDIRRIGEQPPIGMRPDGTLNIVKPGQPIPMPRILAPDGRVLTPAEAQAYLDEADISDLDDGSEV